MEVIKEAGKFALAPVSHFRSCGGNMPLRLYTIGAGLREGMKRDEDVGRTGSSV